MAELSEGSDQQRLSLNAIVSKRSWSNAHVNSILKRAIASRHIDEVGSSEFMLTPFGTTEAMRIVRNHRLWEVYLINYADIAPSHVDRDADMIEHVLGTEMVDKLESLLEHGEFIDSPHPLGECHT